MLTLAILAAGPKHGALSAFRGRGRPELEPPGLTGTGLLSWLEGGHEDPRGFMNRRRILTMGQALTGNLNGNTITLDQPRREVLRQGQRVRVVVEPPEEVDKELSREEHARLWKDWVENGPQGPIEE